MKVGVNLAYKNSRDLIECARAAAGYGFDWIGTVDSPMLFCDTAVASTLVALNTTDCRIGPVVTNPVSRRVEILASELLSLDGVSGHRAVLGISSGDTAVANLGLRAASIAQMEESISQFRALTSPSDGSGATDGSGGRTGTGIPIFVAAGGPRMTDLGARMGDGLILGSGTDPEMVAERLALIRASAAAAGREMAELEVWAMGLVHLPAGAGDDSATSELRSLLAAFAHHSPASRTTGGGNSASLQSGLRVLTSRYDTRQHLAGRSENEALVEELGLTEALAEAYLLPTEPQAILQRFATLEDIGLTGVMLTGTVAQRRQIVESFGRDVMPALR